MTENYWDKLSGTDEGAAQYMLTYGEGPGCATRLLVGQFINDGETVLDVGCGPGWNFDHFQEYGPNVRDYLGLDYSERFVRVANERVQSKFGGPERFKHGDCRWLVSPDDSWDVVILQDCLEHTNGYEVPLREALRVASKRVIVTFWKASFQDGNESENQINDDGDDGYGATYNRKQWEKFLESLGYFWATEETPPEANRWHRLYVIDKEENGRIDHA